MTDTPGIIWNLDRTCQYLRLPITDEELEAMDRARDPEWWKWHDKFGRGGPEAIRRLASLRRAIEALIEMRREG